MLRLITPTRFEWFVPVARDDSPLLDRWRDAPLRYAPDDAEGNRWHRDQHAIPLAPLRGPQAFAAARALLLSYRFYPPRIMTTVGDWDIEKRLMEPGDRLVQRFNMAALAVSLPPLVGRVPLALTTMNAITGVVDSPRRAGFGYTTTVHHREEGVWSVAVTLGDDDALTLHMTAIARPVADEPRHNHWLMRYLQRRAHRLGITHFRTLLAEAVA